MRWRDAENSEMAHVDADVRSLKWKLWHRQTDRALDQRDDDDQFREAARERQSFSDTPAASGATFADLCSLKQKRDYQLRRRYRSGRRIATALAESAVNSLVARRMVKKQQMQWSKRGAPSSAPGSGRRSPRRCSGTPHVRTAETSPSIEVRVDVRTDTATAEDRLIPQSI